LQGRNKKPSRHTAGINNTGGKFATGIKMTLAATFATSSAGVVDTGGGKFATSVNDIGGKFAASRGKLPPVSTAPVANNGNNIRLQTP
jgi:hypothetical protein